MSFVVGDHDAAPEAWERVSDRRAGGEVLEHTVGASVEVVKGASAYVGVSHRADRQSPHAPVYGKVEFNPSRVVDPEGYRLATADEAVEALGLALRAAAPLVVAEEPEALSSYRVKRLDVARDFDCVEAPSALIRGLAPLRRPYSKRNLVHADPARNGAQTLMVGSGAGVVRLYDKHAETKGRAPEGTLRWEAECRAEWSSKYGGISRADGITSESVSALAFDRWRWSAMDAEVQSTSGVIDVVARSGLSPRERMMFVGWLVHQGTPHAYEPGSKTTQAKFRRLQRELRIAVGPEAVSSVGFASRLDWATGREILRVAA